MKKLVISFCLMASSILCVAQWVDTLGPGSSALHKSNVLQNAMAAENEILVTANGFFRVGFDPADVVSLMQYEETSGTLSKVIRGNGLDSLNPDMNMGTTILKDRGFITTSFNSRNQNDSLISTRFWDMRGNMVWQEFSWSLNYPVHSRTNFAALDSCPFRTASGDLLFKDLNTGQTLQHYKRDSLFAQIPDSLSAGFELNSFELEGSYYFLYSKYLGNSDWSTAWFKLEPSGKFSLYLGPIPYSNSNTQSQGEYFHPHNFYVKRKDSVNWQDSTFHQDFYLFDRFDQALDTVNHSGEVQQGRRNFSPNTTCHWSDNGILILSQTSVWDEVLLRPVISSHIKLLDTNEQPVYELQFSNVYGQDDDFLSILDFTWQADNSLYFIADYFPGASGIILGKIDSQGYINHPHLHRLGQDNFSVFNISFYPNPTRSWLHFKGLDPRIKHQVSIHHASNGKLIMDSTIKEIPKIDLSSLAPGVYYVLVKNAAGLRVGRRIVVE